MQFLQIVTVGPTYLPLAGMGMNLIRKYVGPMQGLSVGDNVTHFFTQDASTKEILPDTIEFLKVSSIVIGQLDIICTNHGPNNMAWRLFEEISAFQAHIKELEPTPEGEEENLMQQYMAVYF